MSSRTVTLTQILPIPTGLRQVLLVGFGIVLLALSAKLKVYLGPIPFTLQTLVVLLIGASYGAHLAVLTTTLYLMVRTWQCSQQHCILESDLQACLYLRERL